MQINIFYRKNKNFIAPIILYYIRDELYLPFAISILFPPRSGNPSLTQTQHSRGVLGFVVIVLKPELRSWKVADHHWPNYFLQYSMMCGNKRCF